MCSKGNRPADTEAIPRFGAMASDEAWSRTEVVGLNVRISNEARMKAGESLGAAVRWPAGEVEPGLGRGPAGGSVETTAIAS